MKSISKWAASALVVLALAAVGGVIATFLMRNQDSEAATAKTPTKVEAKKAEAKADAAPAPSSAWATGCQAGANGSQLCSVFQIYQTSQNNQTFQLLKTDIGFFGPDGKPQMMFHVPLGTLLTAGLTVQIDDQKPYTVPLMTCLPQSGCQTQLTMDDAALDNLRNGKKAVVRYVLIANNQTVSVPAPLELAGLSAALKQLPRPQPAPAAPKSSN